MPVAKHRLAVSLAGRARHLVFHVIDPSLAVLLELASREPAGLLDLRPLLRGLGQQDF